jgi:lipoate-protein ligase A
MDIDDFEGYNPEANTNTAVEKQDWNLVISEPLTGLENMNIDNEMYFDFENNKIDSTLRIYGWNKPCISLGYTQDKEKELDIDLCEKFGWDVVKRITGGGIVFHNTNEITYSLVTSTNNVILPKGLIESCSFISKAIILGLETIGIKAKLSDTYNSILKSKWSGRNYQLPVSLLQSIQMKENLKKGAFSRVCFSEPVKYEIMANGKKLVGNAQKRSKKVLFQHGSIPLDKTDPKTYQLLKNEDDRKNIQKNSTSIREILKKNIQRSKVIEALIKGFEKGFGIKFQ